MIARVAKTTLWLVLGHALLAGVYWGLLNVPESNVLMLAASALLALVVVAGAAIVQSVAVRSLATSGGPRSVRTLISTGVPAFIVAMAVWVACSWIVGWVGHWHTAHSGEIDAWLIAHGDWTRTAWLHRGIELALGFVRYVMGVSLAVGVFVTWVVGGLGEALQPQRFIAALNWKRLAIVTAAVVGLMWLPWQAVSWRPASLPPTFVQPLFAAIKLGLIALVVHAGWAFVLWSAIPRATSLDTPSPGWDARGPGASAPG
jgi:hypothetical protein